MRLLRKVDESWWWNVAQHCVYATFFHSPLWLRLTQGLHHHYCDVSVGGETERGVHAMVPLLVAGTRAKGIFRIAMSTFSGCYGGVIADGPLTENERTFLLRQSLKQPGIGEVSLTGNPLLGGSEPIATRAVRHDFTHLLELRQDFSTLFRHFSKGHRSAVTQGERLGVTIRLAGTLDDYRAYYAAYQDSLARWGTHATSRYPWQLFETGHTLTQTYPEHLRLWLAELDEQIVGGAWIFYWNQHVVWWHGASYRQYFGYKPNNVLVAHIIQDACERGYKYFDFNPSGGHEGVARFKKGFGAKQCPVTSYVFAKTSYRLFQKLVSRVKIKEQDNGAVP